MPFCTQCGKEVLATDHFCLNCGRDLSAPATVQVPAQPPPQPSSLSTETHLSAKNPSIAAALNFILPGTGYVYNGVGRDFGEVIFGAFVFIFFFVGFEVGVVGDALSTTVTSSAPSSAFAPLLLLVFLMPFAFAYDGYHRARAG